MDVALAASFAAGLATAARLPMPAVVLLTLAFLAVRLEHGHGR